MPPRALDVCEDVDSAVADDAVADLKSAEEVFSSGENSTKVISGEMFFTRPDTAETDKGPAKENTSIKLSFSSFEKSLSSFGKKLEDGFISAIDATPLGVNVDQPPKDHACTSQNIKSEEKVNSPEAASDAPTLQRKDSSVKKVAKKAAAAVGGGALIGVGIVMIPTLPPPFASITMLSGYALLGKEFEGPRNVVKNARDKMRDIEIEDDDEEEEKNDNGNTESNNSAKETTEIEQEIIKDKQEQPSKHQQIPMSNAETCREYFGYSGNGDNAINKSIQVKKTLRKFSKKYVLPALEKVCTAYEEDEEDKEENKNEVGEAKDSKEQVVVTNVLQDEDSSEGSSENPEFEITLMTKGQEGSTDTDDWIDVEEDELNGSIQSGEDLVLV